MSRLSDYSKFDHMIDSDDDEDHGNAVESLDNDGGTDATIRASPIVEQGTRTGGSDMNSSITISSNPTESSVVDGGVGTGSMGRMMAMTKKDNESGRYIFEFNGQKIYEWEQGLEGVLCLRSNNDYMLGICVTLGSFLRRNMFAHIMHLTPIVGTPLYIFFSTWKRYCV